MANKHIKCSTALIIRYLQMKTTMRYHFTSTGIDKIKKTNNTKVGKDMKKLENS